MKLIKICAVFILIFSMFYNVLVEHSKKINLSNNFSEYKMTSFFIEGKGGFYSKDIQERKESEFLKILEFIKDDKFMVGFNNQDNVVYFVNNMDICEDLKLIKGSCDYPISNMNGQNIVELPGWQKFTFKNYNEFKLLNKNTMLIMPHGTYQKILKQFPENEFDFSPDAKYVSPGGGAFFHLENQMILILIPFMILILLGVQNMMKNEKELKTKQLYDQNILKLIFKNISKEVLEILIYCIISLIPISFYFSLTLDIAYFIDYSKILIIPFIFIVSIYFCLILLSHAFVFYSQTIEILKNRLNILRYLALNLLVFTLIIISTFQILNRVDLNYQKRFEQLDFSLEIYGKHDQIIDKEEIKKLGYDDFIIYGSNYLSQNKESFFLVDSETYKKFYKKSFESYPVVLTNSKYFSGAHIQNLFEGEKLNIKDYQTKGENFLIIDKKDVSKYADKQIEGAMKKVPLKQYIYEGTKVDKFHVYSEMFIVLLSLSGLLLSIQLFYKYYQEYFQKEIKIKKIFSKKYFLLNKVLLFRIMFLSLLLLLLKPNNYIQIFIIYYSCEIIIYVKHTLKLILKGENHD